MAPQGKAWMVKTIDQPLGLVEPPQSTSLTSTSDRSDRPKQPVRPVEPAVQQKAELATPISALCNGGTPLAFSIQGDEELVDYEATPRMQQYGAQWDFSVRGAKYW